jgi:hypothetical protein
VKWLLVLLVALGGGLAAAALTVPTNAAVVNGTAISQATLNGDVSAIADSAEYQCYLNSQEYLSSQGQRQLPPVTGAGKGQNASDHPTATSAFTANYLDTEVGHQLIQELADERGITVTGADLAQARQDLTTQISGVMSGILQTPQGQDPAYSCTATGQPLTGEEVLRTMPASFVDQQVQFVATAAALQEDLAGVGSSTADLERYYAANRRQFDTMCFDAAIFSSEAAASTAAAGVQFGTPFSQATSGAVQQGTIPCAPVAAIASQIPTSVANLESVAVGKASNPIAVGTSQGGSGAEFLVVSPTKRTSTPFSSARSAVVAVVERAGSKATSAALSQAERRASVSVDPRYGTWVAATASVFVPFAPAQTDVLNPTANQASAPATPASPFSG